MDNKTKLVQIPEVEKEIPDSIDIEYKFASAIRPRPIYWLWKNRIPLGEVSVFAGLPGKGKSQLLLYFSSLISNGGLLEIGEEKCQFPQGKVIILSAEDNAESLIVPRLMALGADLSQIAIVEAVRNGFDSDGNTIYSAFDLSTDIKKLNKMASHIKNVKLFLIDPFSAYLGNTKESNNAEMRNLIMQLTKMSCHHMASTFLNTHLNKQTSQTGVLARIQGSGAIVAAPRVVYVIGEHSVNKSQRVLALGKTNVSEHFDHGYVYELEKKEIQVWDEDKQIHSYTTKIKWIGIEQDIVADDLIGGGEKNKDGSKKEQAKKIILSMLQDGGAFRSEIMDVCAEHEIFSSTVNDAKKELGNIYVDESRGKGSTRWYIKP